MDAAAHSRRQKVALIGAFAAFLALGAIGAAFKVPSLLPALSGIEDKSEEKPWTELSWLKTDTPRLSKQHRLEKRFNERVGWRTFLVRLDNQVTWSAFLETPAPKKKDNGEDAGTHVIYGVHEWLFEKHYITHAVTPTTATEAGLRAEIARIKRVQDKLAQRGIAFLLIVAPSKAEIYPEKVPPHLWRGKSKDAVETDFERARPIFRESGINWIDGPELYARWKAEGKRHLFARSGTHWSYRSAVDVIGLMRERLNATMRRPMPPLLVTGEDLLAPQGNDRDLLDLANLLIPQPYEHSVPFPRIEPQRTVADADLPRVLWIHDSFGWPLIDPIYWGKVAAPSESLYYFETQMRKPDGTVLLTHLADQNLGQLNLREYIQTKDAVVVVWTEIAQTFWGWKFFQVADAALE